MAEVEQLELAEREREEWEKLSHRAEAQGIAIEPIYPDGVQLSEPDFRKLLSLAEEAEFEQPERMLSDPDEKQLGPFARESETSRKAALANYPRQGSQRWRILILLRRVEDETPPGRPRGLTREEVGLRLGLTGDSVRPRVRELIEGEWIEESEDLTRRTHLGNDAALVFLTEKALRERRLVEASSS